MFALPTDTPHRTARLATDLHASVSPPQCTFRMYCTGGPKGCLQGEGLLRAVLHAFSSWGGKLSEHEALLASRARSMCLCPRKDMRLWQAIQRSSIWNEKIMLLALEVVRCFSKFDPPAAEAAGKQTSGQARPGPARAVRRLCIGGFAALHLSLFLSVVRPDLISTY